MGDSKSCFHEQVQRSTVGAAAADLQQSSMCRCLCNFDGENAIKSWKQHAIQILRDTVRPVIVGEWRCGTAATGICRTRDLGGSEHGENICPRVSGASPSETASTASDTHSVCNLSAWHSF